MSLVGHHLSHRCSMPLHGSACHSDLSSSLQCFFSKHDPFILVLNDTAKRPAPTVPYKFIASLSGHEEDTSFICKSTLDKRISIFPDHERNMPQISQIKTNIYIQRINILDLDISNTRGIFAMPQINLREKDDK